MRLVNAQTSQPSAGDAAQNTDGFLVVLTNKAGAEQWRGQFSDFCVENAEVFTPADVINMADDLREKGSTTIPMGSHGTFVLTVSTKGAS